MKAEHYRTVATFDAALYVGQRVLPHWTNSHRWYDAAATVTKVNAKSVLAAIDEAIYGRFGGAPTLLYPAGQVIKVPRLTNLTHWTANNCVTPLSLQPANLR